jgi:hypothetical protein
MRPRIAEEIKLLKGQYEDVQYVAEGDWFRIEPYPLPANCSPSRIPITFYLKPGYPGDLPYGFCTPADILIGDQKMKAGKALVTPFAGKWNFFSWTPENWNPTDNVNNGSNLWNWTQGFRQRFEEGA